MVLVACLVSIIVYQRWEMTRPVRQRFISIGESVKPIQIEGYDRKPLRVDWAANPKGTLLYVFAPNCKFCDQNIAAQKALLAAANGYKTLTISLTRDGLNDYLTRHDISGTVYVAQGGLKDLKVTVTPETILIGPDAKVKRVWLGSYKGSRVRAEIEEFFKVKLPEQAGAE